MQLLVRFLYFSPDVGVAGTRSRYYAPGSLPVNSLSDRRRRITQMLALILLSAPLLQAQNAGQTASLKNSIDEHLTMVLEKKWDRTEIPVCWEPAAAPMPAFQQEKEWVKVKIAVTWEAQSSLRFTGWQTCAPINNGIRILISDEQPKTKDLGIKLNRLKDGMVLNFTFKNWGQPCADEKLCRHCIEAISLHEFGHAIGFTHEDYHPMAPPKCKALQQGLRPTVALTVNFDQASTMCYCNPRYLNDGNLSEGDKRGLQKVYPKQR